MKKPMIGLAAAGILAVAAVPGTANAAAPQTVTWYPSAPYRMGIQLALPAGDPWIQVPDRYRKAGAVWDANANEEVAVSLNTPTISQFTPPPVPPSHIIAQGGDAGTQVWIWTGAQGQTIHGTELVDLGTVQYGWAGTWGGVNGPGTATRTLLINVTLPDSRANEVATVDTLMNWSAVDTLYPSRPTDNAQEDAACRLNCWPLSAWPLNPLQNSNAAQMPWWF